MTPAIRAAFILLLWIWPGHAAFAQRPDATKLERAYSRAALAAEIKFVDGLLANRARGYKVLAPDGSRMDLSLERQRFEQLFALGSRVRFETRIVQVVPAGSGMDALVEQALRVEVMDPSGQLGTQVVLSQVIDHWELIDGKLRMTVSKLMSQVYTKGPQLKEDRLWPMQPVKPKLKKKGVSP